MSTAENITPIVKPYAGIVSVDPKTAQRWLDQYNTGNRRIRPADVNSYARDMAAGNWLLTAEPIKFGSDGRLLDGQHRLLAVVKAGVTILLFVARGIDPDAQKVMDTGSKRSAADMLGLDGKINSVILAAASALALAVKQGRLDLKTGVTHSEINDFISEHPEMEESARFASRYARRTDVPPALVAYTHWRLSKIDAARADQFWIDASEKVGLIAADPIIALTNRFAEARRNRERLPRAAMLSLIYRAWNYRRASEQIKMLRVNSSAGGLVPIPEPR